MTRRSTTWHKTFKQTGLSDPEAKAEYEAFKLQLELADQLKKRKTKSTSHSRNGCRTYGNTKTGRGSNRGSGRKREALSLLKNVSKICQCHRLPPPNQIGFQ